MRTDEGSVDGRASVILYSFFGSPFGECIAASTHKGLCHLAYCNERSKAVHDLKERFTQWDLRDESDRSHVDAFEFMADPLSFEKTVPLHVMGTDFQLRVWEELLKIPFGQTTSYGRLAKALGDPKASRAVGAAVGRNPVACIIPCHRVVHSDGAVGNYMWGAERKRAILAWEAGRYGLFG
jgi:AraC family transcriptional regulator of adaptative response/methylated-DNA-[protein]-cysteine methyltransferase